MEDTIPDFLSILCFSIIPLSLLVAYFNSSIASQFSQLFWLMAWIGLVNSAGNTRVNTQLLIYQRCILTSKATEHLTGSSTLEMLVG